MDILFLGGTGNISTDCAAKLRAEGHRVAMVTRGNSPVPEEYSFFRADRRNGAELRQALGNYRPDVVVDFIGYDVPDVQTTADVFAGRVSQYVFISTTVVYSKPPARLPVTEEDPLGNVYSAYGQKKQACEEFLLDCHRSGRLPVTIIRPSHTYSHRWMPNPVTSVGYTTAARLEQGKPVFIHDDGQGLWTLTSTRDFAVGLAGLIGCREALGEAIQITSDQVLTWNQIMAEIALSLGVQEPNIVHIPSTFIAEVCPVMHDKLMGDKAHPGVFDNAKIKHLVPDFECSISFRQGIREAVSWFRADSARQVVNPETDAIFDRVVAAWRQKCAS